MKTLKRAILLSSAYAKDDYVSYKNTNAVSASRFLNLIFSQYNVGEVTTKWKYFCMLYLVRD